MMWRRLIPSHQVGRQCQGLLHPVGIHHCLSLCQGGQLLELFSTWSKAQHHTLLYTISSPSCLLPVRNVYGWQGTACLDQWEVHEGSSLHLLQLCELLQPIPHHFHSQDHHYEPFCMLS